MLSAAARSVFGNDGGAHSAARVPVGGDLHPAGTERVDELVEDPVRDGFVEDALLAERLEVELQALELDAQLLRGVLDGDRAEIRLAGHGAAAGEFRRDVRDDVVAAGVRIGEHFEAVGAALQRAG